MRPYPSCHSRTRFGFVILLAGVVWAVSSCNSASLIAACTAAPSRAIVVSVRDSTTGAPAATDAFGTIKSAGVVDTLQHSDSLKMFGGTELGTCDVDIERAGYLPWTASSVHVTETGMCGNVVPVQLSARLQPATP
jgi:hypothetical protein